MRVRGGEYFGGDNFLGELGRGFVWMRFEEGGRSKNRSLLGNRIIVARQENLKLV